MGKHTESIMNARQQAQQAAAEREEKYRKESEAATALEKERETRLTDFLAEIEGETLSTGQKCQVARDLHKVWWNIYPGGLRTTDSIIAEVRIDGDHWCVAWDIWCRPQGQSRYARVSPEDGMKIILEAIGKWRVMPAKAPDED